MYTKTTKKVFAFSHWAYLWRLLNLQLHRITYGVYTAHARTYTYFLDAFVVVSLVYLLCLAFWDLLDNKLLDVINFENRFLFAWIASIKLAKFYHQSSSETFRITILFSSAESKIIMLMFFASSWEFGLERMLLVTKESTNHRKKWIHSWIRADLRFDTMRLSVSTNKYFFCTFFNTKNS